MQIGQHTEQLIAFLLVREDGVTPAPKAAPVVRISRAGGAFGPASQPVAEIGAGWYAIQLTTEETGEIGPLIITADGNATMEWREIHYIKATRPPVEELAEQVLAQLRTDEIAEQAAALIDPEAIAAGLEQAAREAVAQALENSSLSLRLQLEAAD